MHFDDVVDKIEMALDGVGVAILAVGVVIASVLAVARLAAHEAEVYRRLRQMLGRSILLGLEVLVAADIVRTVAVEPTFSSVAVLGIIVLIRTFLSFSLELEITGRWPWQKATVS